MLNQIGSFIPEGQLMRYKSNLNFNKNDLVNFKDFVEEKQAETAANPTPYADLNSIQRISIKDMNFHYFEPTGDEEIDRIIQLGYDYRKSCFDLTNRKDYEAMTAAEDFTGMTDAEIYKAIYEKYQHCYGENFFEANAIDYINMNMERTYGSILMQFNNELSAVFGEFYNHRTMQARREALYGDMSDSEIRQTIMEKYMEDGNITLRNLFKAANEMDSCGVGGKMLFAMIDFGDGHESLNDRLPREEFIFAREANMDQYVTPRLFQQLYRSCENQVNFCNGDPNKMAAINQILEMCNGGYGSTGSASGFVSKAAIEEMFSRMGYIRKGI